MNTTIKNYLTAEQSATLIAKGISADKASMVRLDFNGTYAYVSGEEAQSVRDCVNGQFYVEECRVFALADITALLPNELSTDTIMCDNDICPISIRWDKNCQKWFVGYDLVPRPVGVGVDSELIDALYSLLCWTIEKGYIDLTK